MKILLLSSQDPNDLANGIGSIAHNSLHCLRELGHSVQVICITNEKRTGFPVHYAQCRSDGIRDLVVTRFARPIAPQLDGLRALAGAWLTKEERNFATEVTQRSRECDLAIWFGHMWDPLTRALLNCCRCPVILHVNDSITLVRQQRSSSVGGRIQTALARFLEAAILRRMKLEAAGIVYVGDEDRRSALSMARVPNADAVFSLPLAVDTVTFSPSEDRPAAAGAETTEAILPVLLFTGHMGYGPNITAAIHLVEKVLPLLPANVKVRLVGKSPAQAISALAALDKRVCVTGEVHDIVAEYRAADIFLAPISFSYGMKTKVLEAMACGLPVVASPGAASGFDGTPPGVLVGNTDQELAALTIALLRDAGLRRATGAAGRRHVLGHHRWIDRTRRLAGLLRTQPDSFS